MFRISLLALLLAASSAAAQTTSQDAANTFGPGDPAKSRAVQYRSVFGPEQPAREPADISWKDANDEMGRLRGHGGQLTGDTTAAPKDSAPASSPAPAVPTQHRH